MAFRGTLQDIRLFVAAYEERSFTAAARRENTTQSGVSHHMRQMEQLLKVTLFVRERSGVIATPAADLLYRECVDTLRGLDHAAKQIGSLARGQQGEFTVAISPAITYRVVAPALLRFIAEHPNVRVQIVESIADAMPHQIKSGEVNFAISAVHGGGPGIRARQLLAVPECLIFRANREDLSATNLAEGINLVLPVLKERRRAAIIDSLASQGIKVNSLLEIDSALTILDLVGRSHWSTVSPCLIIDPASDDRFKLRPLRRLDLIYRMILLEPETSVLPPGAEEFVEMVTQEATSLMDQWNLRFQEM